MDSRTYANADVLDFYRTLPFNFCESIEQQAASITRRNSLEAYRDLVPVVKKARRVLDVGCGTGWLANSLALYHDCEVVGIDFNELAVRRARSVAAALNLDVRLETRDLFLYRPSRRFDVAISIGVLHHTDNCAYGLEQIITHCLADRGYLYVGLYHAHGRRPFLDYFAGLKRRGLSEEELFCKYRELHSHITDDTQLRSWFRDQVMHPHETQHTLQEVHALLNQTNMRLLSTSLNRFAPIDDLEGLFASEAALEQAGRDALSAMRYFPGFFTFLAQAQ